MNYKNQYLFVLFIPILNSIAANTTEIFSKDLLSTGFVRALLLGVFALFFIAKKYSVNRVNIFLLIFLMYFLILSFLSSDLILSFTLYIKLFLGVIMFPIGYYYINSKDKILALMKVFLIVLVIYLINILISNILKIGTSDYLEDSFYFGTGRVNVTKAMLLLIIFTPLTLSYLNNRFLLYLIYFLGTAIAIIGIKRSVLLSGLSSLLIYSFLNRKKTYFIKGMLALTFGIIVFIIFFPSLTDIFLQRLDARNERIYVTEESLSEEARYNEVTQVIETWQKGSIKHKIFGSEFFNDRSFFKTNRILHIDYMILLNGSGILGIFLWFLTFWIIIKEKNKYYRYLKNEEFFDIMNTIFYMLLAAQLLMSISSTIYSIDIRSIIFLYWGAMIGTMRTSYLELKYYTDLSVQQS